MVPKDHRESAFYTATDVKFLCSVVCMVTTLLGLFSLLPEIRNLKLAAITVEKSTQWIGVFLNLDIEKEKEV